MLSKEIAKLEQENAALKEQIEKLQDICGNKVELPRNCEYCSNFIQYYIKNNSLYYPTCNGRCMAGNRVKGRKVNDTCKAFTKKEYRKNCI